jgi:ribosomal protein S17E
MPRVSTHLMEKHIRYVIDGYTTQRVEDIKNALKSNLTNLDDDIKM